MQRFYDVSAPISPQLPVYPGDPAVRLELFSSLAGGEDYDASALSMSVHAGTHLDAPRHFHARGKTVDELPLDLLVGAAFVADVSGPRGAVSAPDLARARVPAGVQRLLIKTGASPWWKRTVAGMEHRGLTEEAAHWLLNAGIKLVGIDRISIDADANGFPVHRLLLSQDAAILEGLDLTEVQPGPYELICLPLKLIGVEGSPARVILIPRD